MPNVQGQIEKIYHNYVDKQNNKLPDNKVNHKLKINGELYIIKGKYCPDWLKEGIRVSIAYNVWQQPSTGMNHNYVMKDKQDKLLIRSESEPQEDDLPDDDLDNGGNSFAPPESDTDFDPNKLEKQGETYQVLKEQQIFVTALLKSSIEANQIKSLDSESMNKAVLAFKDLYNNNFR